MSWRAVDDASHPAGPAAQRHTARGGRRRPHRPAAGRASQLHWDHRSSPRACCGPPVKQAGRRTDAAGVQPWPCALAARDYHRGLRACRRLPGDEDQWQGQKDPPPGGQGLPPAAALGQAHAGQPQGRRPRQQPRGGADARTTSSRGSKPSQNMQHSFDTNSERKSSAPKQSKPVLSRMEGEAEREEFESISTAARALGLSSGTFRQHFCLLPREAEAGGYEFEFAPKGRPTRRGLPFETCLAFMLAVYAVYAVYAISSLDTGVPLRPHHR